MNYTVVTQISAVCPFILFSKLLPTPGSIKNKIYQYKIMLEWCRFLSGLPLTFPTQHSEPSVQPSWDSSLSHSNMQITSQLFNMLSFSSPWKLGTTQLLSGPRSCIYPTLGLLKHFVFNNGLPVKKCSYDLLGIKCPSYHYIENSLKSS